MRLLTQISICLIFVLVPRITLAVRQVYPPEIERILAKGSYQPSQPSEARVLEKLQELVNQLTPQHFDPIHVQIVRGFELSTQVAQGYDNFLFVGHGLINLCENLDQLAIALIYQIGFLNPAYLKDQTLLTQPERWLHQQRDEMAVGDQFAFDYANMLGFDVREMDKLLLQLSKLNLNSYTLPGLGKHPNSEIRMTALRTRLRKENEKKQFPEPQPMPEELRSLSAPVNAPQPQLPPSLTVHGLKAAQLAKQTISYARWGSHERFKFIVGLLTERPSAQIIFNEIMRDQHVPIFPDMTPLEAEISTYSYAIDSKPGEEIIDIIKAGPLVEVVSDALTNGTLQSYDSLEGIHHFYTYFLYRFPIPYSMRADLELLLYKTLKPDFPAPKDKQVDWTSVKAAIGLHEVQRHYLTKLICTQLSRTSNPAEIFEMLHWPAFFGSHPPILEEYCSEKALAHLRRMIGPLIDYAARNGNLDQFKLLPPITTIKPLLYRQLVALSEHPSATGLFKWSALSYSLKYLDSAHGAKVRHLRDQVIRRYFPTPQTLLQIGNSSLPEEMVKEFVQAHAQTPLNWEDFETVLNAKKELWGSFAATGLRSFVTTTLDFTNPALSERVRNSFKNLDRYSGPAYNFRLTTSELLQKWLINGLQLSGHLKPLNLNSADSIQTWRQLWSQLAARGSTTFIDELADQLWSDESLRIAPVSNNHIYELLEKQLIWDFSIRRRLWHRIRHDKLQVLKHRGTRSHQALQVTTSLDDDLIIIDRIFPEASYERLRAFEEFSEEITSTQAEATIIEAAKLVQDKNFEAVALRVFTGIIDLAKHRGSKSQMELLEALMGEDSSPDFLEEIGESRVKRMMASLSPEVRALVLHPLLGPPEGLLEQPATRQIILNKILANLDPYESEAKLILNAVLSALRKTAPFEESLALAMMLALKQPGERKPTGQSVREGLEALGNTGVRMGQIFRQRRIGSPDILTHLDDLQARVRVPTRMQRFLMIANALGHKDLDHILTLNRNLGAASARVVELVKYFAVGDETVLKVQREHLERSTHVEIEKMHTILDYLITHGGPKYRPLRSVIDFTEWSLRTQTDSRIDAQRYKLVSPLYKDGEIDPASGFRFVVVRPDWDLGITKQHLHESLAQGKLLWNLPPHDESRALQAIYFKEKSILLRETTNADDDIFFEADRHRGNFVIDMQSQTPTVYVVDYPLTASIKAFERDSIFQVLGYLYGLRGNSETSLPAWLPQPMQKWIARKFIADLAIGHLRALFQPTDDTTWELKKEELRNSLQSRKTSEDLVAELLDLIASAEQEGLHLKPDVNKFLVALSNLDFYAQYAPQEDTLEDAIRGNFYTHQQPPTLTAKEYLLWATNQKELTASLQYSRINTCSSLLNVAP